MRHDIDKILLLKRVYIVLPEVFGVNAWVRSVADRLAAQGIPALAVPLFARTAPELELGYETSDLAQGRPLPGAVAAGVRSAHLSVRHRRSPDPPGERLRYVEINGVDHGFMCEARDSFDAEASALGWQLMLA